VLRRRELVAGFARNPLRIADFGLRIPAVWRRATERTLSRKQDTRPLQRGILRLGKDYSRRRIRRFVEDFGRRQGEEDPLAGRIDFFNALQGQAGRDAGAA
jgi:hypothetical protein